MKTVNCPLNGPCPLSEFVCGREVKEMPDPSTCSDKTWATHLLIEDNEAAEIAEWWMHAPTSYWFIVRRNVDTDEIIGTYSVEDFFGASTNRVEKQAA